MSPYAERPRVLWRKGDEVRPPRGRPVKDARRREAPVCTNEVRKMGGRPEGGRVAPILDGPGDVPPSPVKLRRNASAAEGVDQRTKTAAPGGERGSRREAGPKRTRCPRARSRQRRGARRPLFTPKLQTPAYQRAHTFGTTYGQDQISNHTDRRLQTDASKQDWEQMHVRYVRSQKGSPNVNQLRPPR